MKTNESPLTRVWLALLVLVVMTAVSIGCMVLGLPKEPTATACGLVAAFINVCVLWS